MPATTTEAFERRHVTREDGVDVLPRKMINVAALEAGYCLSSPTIDIAVGSAIYQGQMTAEEFQDLCQKNQSAFLSAEALAKSVVVVAPAGVITRGSLEQIFNKSSSRDGALTEEEMDALFVTLDTDNKGAFTAEEFMRAIYGEEGALCLAERRKMDAGEAARRRELTSRGQSNRNLEDDTRNGAGADGQSNHSAGMQRATSEGGRVSNKSKDKDGKKGKGKEKKKKAKACC